MKRGSALFLLLSVWLTPAAALTIRGDADWREDPDCTPGWESLTTDDREWRPVIFPWMHLRPPEWPIDSLARPIWGRSPSAVTCVRRTFELQRSPHTATAHVWVDDDYDLFVNGHLLARNADLEARLPGESHDIGPHLRQGGNVVGLRLADVGGARGALVSLSIEGEPERQESSHQRAERWRPWLTAGLFIGGVILWCRGLGHSARRLGRLQRHRAAERLGLAALLAATLVQGFLAVVVLYSGEREIPVLQWNLPGLVVLVSLLSLLAIVAYRLPDRRIEAMPICREWLLLAAVVGIGLLFRIAWIDQIPIGFFQDEATNGNDALTLGAQPDWFIWSDSVGGRPTLFLYLLHGVFEFFGTSYTSLKIAPVTIGTLTIVALYALARIGFGSRVALWAALLLAVSRWHVHYSRMAWEAILLPLFSIAGFALLLHGIQGRRWARTAAVASGCVLSLGLYGYAAYRAVPAVVIVFLVWTLVSRQRQAVLRLTPALLLAAGAALAIVWPLAHFAWMQPELYWTRYNEVSLTQFMSYYGTPWPWLEQLGRSALSFNHVGDEIIRHNLPLRPHLDPITGVLFVLGLAITAWRTQDLATRFLWAWMLTYLALASLTCDGPHATRLLGLLPVAVLCAAIALEHLRTAFWTWGSDATRRGVVVALATTIALANAYDYFRLEARHPTASVELNVTGRLLCEEVRRRHDVEVYWSNDIAFWADGQCFFLARGRYTLPRPLRIEDLQRGSTLADGAKERLIVIGPEMVQAHADLLRPAGDRLQTALPTSAEAIRDHAGRILYWQILLLPEKAGDRPGAGS